jgi:unsaturated chondroitin disaccharide hydrolase
MIQSDPALTPEALLPRIRRFWEISGGKVETIEREWDPTQGSPVFTVEGRYTTRGWTEWTQGFQFGSALLQFDATGDRAFLELGRNRTRDVMAPHLTHTGVHDHGFNNVSTFGNLWRLAREGRFEAAPWESRFYELALRCSGAVQASRWTPLPDGGFIPSVNGPHTRFADTIRSQRSHALAHVLGHVLLEEQDRRVSLLERLFQHARTTARYSVYYGEGRDAFDVRGRVAHESIFNVRNGSYRGPSTQQGYSPFSTWTRGLAWVMCGFAEQLELLSAWKRMELAPLGGGNEVRAFMLEAARASCDFYLERTPSDGVPYWDTGAPGLAALEGALERPADPANKHEPVDSSAAAIAAQGLLRLGRYLGETGEDGRRYWQAGLTIVATLLDENGPYLGTDPDHQGPLLHSVYHRPGGWDFVPEGAGCPRGESCMWGDYHAREVALYVQRVAEGQPYLTFFGPPRADDTGAAEAQGTQKPRLGETQADPARGDGGRGILG